MKTDAENTHLPDHTHSNIHDGDHAILSHYHGHAHDIDYDALMRQRGYRVTPQRQFILEAIHDSGGHTTLDDICERVQAKAPAINKATVYRTLDFLCQLRIVASSEIGGRRVYEIVGEHPHHHLVCRSCGKEQQITDKELRHLFDGIEKAQGFTVDMEHLILLGWCRECRISGTPSEIIADEE